MPHHSPIGRPRNVFALTPLKMKLSHTYKYTALEQPGGAGGVASVLLPAHATLLPPMDTTNQIDVLHSCGHNRSKIAFISSRSSSSPPSSTSSSLSSSSATWSSSAGHDGPEEDDCKDGRGGDGGSGGGSGVPGVAAQRHHYDPQPCNYCRATRGHWKRLVRRVTEEYYVRRYGKKACFRRVRVWIMDQRDGRRCRRP